MNEDCLKQALPEITWPMQGHEIKWAAFRVIETAGSCPYKTTR